LLTPEMISFASLSNTNVMQACVASAGLLYVCLWFTSREKPLLVLGCVLLAVNCWIRMEGVVFVLTAALMVAFRLWRDSRKGVPVTRGQGVRVSLLLLLPFLPVLVFLVYSQWNGLTSEGTVITRLFWDYYKLIDIAGVVPFHMFKAGYFGWTFYLAAAALLAELVLWFKFRRHNLHVLVALLLSLFFYLVILYQIDYVWDSLVNILNYSVKRFMFCFVPVTWFFTVSSPPVAWLFGVLERKLSMPWVFGSWGKNA